VPILLLFANNAVERMDANLRSAVPDTLYVLYTGAVAAQLMIVMFAHLQRVPAERRRTPNRLAALGAVGAFLVVVPAALGVGVEGVTRWGMMLAAVICLVSLGLYLTVRRMAAWPKVAPWDLRLQMLSSAAATALVLPLHLWHLGVL
jgi:hypothetical protein